MAKVKKGAKVKRGKGLTVLLIIVIAIVVILFYFLSGGAKYSQSDVDVFAKCLTEKEVVMYGAYWCPHCARTKKTFGSSFRYINYVECDPNGENEQSEFCLSKEITQYDTWEFANGERLISEPTFQQLSEKSGCPVPEAK